VWTSLAVTAAAMLGWHPELAWDVGFQLSFAGTAAIILLTPAIERRLPRMPAILREPFAVTCAAQVGTLPMMATDFHVLSPIAPLANALTLPILPVLVAAGLLLGPLALTPDLARMAALPLAGLLAYIEQVAYVLARVPAAAITVPRFPTWAGLAYYSALAPGIAGARSTGRRRAAGLVSAVVAPTLIAGVALAAWANSAPQVSVLNVGDGQAILFRGAQGAILIDSGPSPQRLKDELGVQLPPWQLKLDAVAITAPTLGHIGGFAGLDRAAATVLIPDGDMTGSAWRTAALEAATRGATIERVHAGTTIAVGGFTLEAMAPESGTPGDVVGAAYLALRVVASSGRSFCDLSDLDVDAQTMAAARLSGGCSYLLIPGGGRSLLSPELERAAGPNAQLIASRSAGRLAQGFSPTVLRTDQEGTITLPM
jgi:competence protein ComEC